MKYAIGIDIGTSGTKAALYDREGNDVFSKTYEYPLYQPQNGYAEQQPSDWWEAAHKALRAVSRCGVAPSDIAGIGLSGQMHGLVMLDGENEVIRPAIIWCDGRTKKECAELTEIIGAQRLLDITANPAVAGFTAAKILWIKHNEPENYAKCRHILLPKDYVRFMLTGDYASDVSDASGTQLLDIGNRCWSDELLKKLDIDKATLPKLYESVEVTGRLSKAAAEQTGLPAGLPIVAGGGDNACAAVGTGVIEADKAFTTLGTSGVLFAHTPKMVIDPKGRVHTFCAAVPNEWHIMGVTQAAGLSMKWLRDNICQDEINIAQRENMAIYAMLDHKASQVPIGAGKLIYLPYLMGERTPHLNPDCRGVFFGLSAAHKKENIIRAVLEGVSYSMRDCMEVMKENKVTVSDMTLCGGGANSPLWRQMIADVYGCDVKTLRSNEGGALGAAILAFVGVGEYETLKDACGAIIAADKTYRSNPEAHRRYNEFYEVYRSLYPSLKESYQMLARL